LYGLDVCLVLPISMLAILLSGTVSCVRLGQLKMPYPKNQEYDN